MLLKQRNIVVRPENAEKCELEIKKLEHFGWIRVREKSNEDGSALVSFVRDEDECADKVESEKKYRSAKVASDYAAAAAEKLNAEKESKCVKKGKAGIVLTIVFGVLALLFVGLAIVPFMLQVGFYDDIFAGETIAHLGGEWTFFGFSRFNFQNSGFVVVALLFTLVFSLFAVLFVALGAFFFVKNWAKNLSACGENSISDKIAYFEEVKATADADIAELYPACN